MDIFLFGGLMIYWEFMVLYWEYKTFIGIAMKAIMKHPHGLIVESCSIHLW